MPAGEAGGSAPGEWWRSGVVYQVYPRSFQDSNGDGIGDLPGVLARLDHIVELGATMLWLTPFFASPNHDNGYDISDYQAIDPRQGTLGDVDVLIAECRARGLRVILDMVFNHSSDRHPWFLESAASRDNPKRDWYVWRPGRQGSPPNNWSAGFSPSAWERHPATGDYYLHYYSTHMPDLNWDNAALRAETYRIMNWWADRGVDGFRLDSINLIKKNSDFPDAITPDPASPGYFYDEHLIYNQPGILDLFRDMRRKVWADRDFVAIGETSVTPAEVASDFVRAENRALDMVFNFEPVEMPGFDLLRFKDIQRRWYAIIRNGGWTTQYLSNHDQPRQVSRFGDDGAWWARSAKLLALMLHTLPGTPFIYQGEEIGMTNVAFDTIGAYDDLATLNRHRTLVADGVAPAEALAMIRPASRDNARTPMQWTGGAGAGFTSGTPWLPINPDHRSINVEAQQADSGSILAFYRRLTALRRAHRVMWAGDYRDHLPDDPHIHVYSRRHEAAEWLVVLNVGGEARDVALPGGGHGRPVIGTAGEPRIEGGRARLRPWEGFVLAREVI